MCYGGISNCNPGQTKTATATLLVRHDVEPGGIAKFDAMKEKSGIQVVINPKQFKIYPNIIYATLMTVSVDKNVPAGISQAFIYCQSRRNGFDDQCWWRKLKVKLDLEKEPREVSSFG
jgi:hypothetical protein